MYVIAGWVTVIVFVRSELFTVTVAVRDEDVVFAEAETFTVAEFVAEPEVGDTVNQDWFEVAVQALFADTVNDEDEADEVVFYGNASKTAEEEGFTDIAKLFSMIKNVEEKHSKIFKYMYEKLKNGELYKAESDNTGISGDANKAEASS